MNTTPKDDIRSKILRHGQELKEAVDKHRTAPENWHTTLLLALAGELLFNCKEVIEGESESNCFRTAWGARNLLELHYWVRFVADSPENARRFHEDLVCDIQDLLKKIADEPGTADFVRQIKAQLSEVAPHLQQVGLGQKRLDIFEIAKGFKDEVEYAKVSKLLSKFVHPTSLSIQSRLIPIALSFILTAILLTAGALIEKTFTLMARALDEHLTV